MHSHYEAGPEAAIWVEVVHLGGKGKSRGWEMNKEVHTARVSTAVSHEALLGSSETQGHISFLRGTVFTEPKGAQETLALGHS